MPAPKDDLFKVRKTKADISTPKNADYIVPPDEIKSAIDSYRAAQDQAKHYEGEATVYKDTIIEYAASEYAKRAFSGDVKGFKMNGEEASVHYIVQDSSSGLSEEEYAEFIDAFGEKAANELIVRDFASIRFDAKILETHYEEVVEALQKLRPEILESLFKPMLMKAASDVAHKAKRYARSPEDFARMVRLLKIKNYIK